MKKIIILITTLVLGCMIILTMVYLDLKRYAIQPVTLEKDQPKTMMLIQPGSSLVKVADQLEEKGLVKAPLKFRLLAMIYGLDKGVQAGEYYLAANMTPMQIIQMITKGQVHLHHITIPEGFSLNQIAKAVEQAGFGDADTFLETAKNPVFIARLNITADSLEGYLFPDTYFFA
ncbi:MAG: endolytic transglycosylase MltG, partial [Desulfobacteraceae bacterium]